MTNLEPCIIGCFERGGAWYDIVGRVVAERGERGRIRDAHLDLHWIERDGVCLGDDERDELTASPEYRARVHALRADAVCDAMAEEWNSRHRVHGLADSLR